MVRQVIESFLKKHQIPQDAGFIVTVSGGADSISLLHAFKYLNLRILVLHCNFSLRGKESDMDEQFVKRFCESYGITHRVKKFNTIEYANEKGISIEMAARELRYAWFKEIKEKKNMDYIVAGHHADDVAETVFINYCRGTGIKGLTGIKPINNDVIRPLLSCTKADILNYIEENQLGYHTDSSNNSLDHVRNRIRHQVIPVLKEINPSFLDTVADNCNTFTETEKIFRYGIQKLQESVLDCEEDEILIDIAKTLATPAPYTLLYEILKPFGFNKTQIGDILNSHTAIPGKQFVANKHILVRGRTYWRLYDNSNNIQTTINIDECGNYNIGSLAFEVSCFPKPENFEIPMQSNIACMDADKVKFPLLIRNWQVGDYFCPIGMKKSKKKLSDFFIDQKFSSKQKKECLLLNSDNKICWIINHRLDDRFKINALTKNIIQVHIKK